MKTIDGIKVKTEPTLHVSCSNESHNYEEVDDECSDLFLDPMYENDHDEEIYSPIIVEAIVVTSVETPTI